MRAPIVAIVGRPNVGKSTLFNRIVGRRIAIVEERPGVTRDRKFADADWGGKRFVVVDTGGWMPGGTELDRKVSRQSERAVLEADVVLFVVDVAVGITDADAAAADWLRRTARAPVLVVANKADNERRDTEAWELLGLGFAELFPVSALHGRRTGDLLDRVLELIPDAPDADGIDDGDDEGDLDGPDLGEDVGFDLEGFDDVSGDDGDVDLRDLDLRDLDDDSSDAGSAGSGTAVRRGADADAAIPGIALVGRPNVGKSTLFNRLIGEDRAVVHDMPGTTRDAIDTVVETPDGPLRFIDTAGMRRRSRIDEGTEFYSAIRALRAVDEADVALLVIDATEGVTHQDQRLAERIDAAGCPIVVLLNKWELLDAEQRADVTLQVQRRLHFVGDAPVLKISALTGKGVHKLLPVLADAIERYHRRVPTRDVNRVLASAQQQQPAPHGAKVLYALQGAADPPTFTLFVNRELPPAYLRFLERKLRESFDLGAVPVKLRVRKRS
jgi:GTP-binding protein